MGQGGASEIQISPWRVRTAAVRMRPHVLIVGAMKAGTTFLFHLLRQHPSFAAPLAKELHYFDNNYQNGPAWYRAHFPLHAWMNLRRRARMASGEATPYYLFHPLAPERVRETCPDARIVVLLRDPVERAYSHYQQNVRFGSEPLAFEQALDAEPERLRGEEARMVADPHYYSWRHQTYSYIARGEYEPQLARWIDRFGRARVLVLETAAMRARPAEAFARLLGFAGLPPFEPRRLARQNVGRYPDMCPGTRLRLARHFRGPNERLFALLGERFAWETAADIPEAARRPAPAAVTADA